MSNLNRRAEIADLLEEVMEDGEEYFIHCQDGTVLVKDVDSLHWQQKHRQLYGRLLSLDEQIGQAGSNLSIYGIILGGAFCLGIYLEWWNGWLGDEVVAAIQSFWFYLVFMFSIIVVLGSVATWLEKGVYRRDRADLLEAMAEESVDRDTMLAMIEGDPCVARAAEMIKQDREAGERAHQRNRPSRRWN